jgi:hypothetical protein
MFHVPILSQKVKPITKTSLNSSTLSSWKGINSVFNSVFPLILNGERLLGSVIRSRTKTKPSLLQTSRFPHCITDCTKRLLSSSFLRHDQKFSQPQIRHICKRLGQFQQKIFEACSVESTKYFVRNYKGEHRERLWHTFDRACPIAVSTQQSEISLALPFTCAQKCSSVQSLLLKSWSTQNFITIKTSWNTND